MLKIVENKIINEMEVPLDKAVQTLTNLKQEKTKLEVTLVELQNRLNLLDMIKKTQPNIKQVLLQLIMIQSHGTWTLEIIKNDKERATKTLEIMQNDIDTLQTLIGQIKT